MSFIPWRLILSLIVMILIAFFAGFNLQPVSISVGFHIFKDIPLFLALISFFILGALIMVPFTILGKVSKRKELKQKETKKKEQFTDEGTDEQAATLPVKEKSRKKRNRLGTF